MTLVFSKKIRVAHVSMLFSAGRMDGVRQKLFEMAESAKLAHIDIDFYLINRESSGCRGSLIEIRADSALGFFTGFKLRAFKYFYLIKLIDLEKYDAVVVRYHYSDFSVPLLFRSNLPSIFFEHHTKELNEIWRSGMPAAFKLVTYFLEKLLAPYALRNSAGVVAVTQEFLNHQIVRARLPANKATLVLPNGALIRAYEAKLLPFDQVFRLVFVADRFRPWHGLERLLKSIASYNGDGCVELVLVGQLSSSQKADVNKVSASTAKVRIQLECSLCKDDLLDLLSSCHLAIDSLATYKLGLSESSTLKVKLYLEAGIPWVSATADADVGEDMRVCYLVENSANAFEISELIHWRKQLNAQIFTTTLADLRLGADWQVKLLKLHDWVSANLKS